MTKNLVSEVYFNKNNNKIFKKNFTIILVGNGKY